MSWHGNAFLIIGGESTVSPVDSHHNGPGAVFCLLLKVRSGSARPITGQVTKVIYPVISRAQPELTPSKRQKAGPEKRSFVFFSTRIKWLITTCNNDVVAYDLKHMHTRYSYDQFRWRYMHLNTQQKINCPSYRPCVASYLIIVSIWIICTYF